MNTKNTSKLWPVLILMALFLAMTGCESEPTSPGNQNNQNDQAPILPAAERLQFNFSFFDAGEKMSIEKDGSKLNFINAYLRVAVINAMTRLVLTPPVTAFALALHTVPSPQQDGSWIWVYTYVDGEEEAQIRLRGLPITDGVEWELRVTVPDLETPLDNEVWFDGVTRNEGELGHWTFYDPTLEGDPPAADLDWGHDAQGEFLTFTCRHGDDEGDVLGYYADGPENSIIFTDASEGQEWFIRWNEADSSGSLMVPEYNNGEVACWDENQDDVECE